jgi:hypothetical protein
VPLFKPGDTLYFKTTRISNKLEETLKNLAPQVVSTTNSSHENHKKIANKRS